MNFRLLLIRAAVAAAIGVAHLANPAPASARIPGCIICLPADQFVCGGPGTNSACIEACGESATMCSGGHGDPCPVTHIKQYCGIIE